MSYLKDKFSNYVSFEYSPCAVEYTETEDKKYKHIQVVLPECAEFWGVYGRIKDETTSHLLADHIIDVRNEEQAKSLVNFLNSLGLTQNA